MQYRSGTNPSEPSNPEEKSQTWKFILRSAQYPTLPEAFGPHTNFVAWIAQPQGNSGRWLIRGYCQWANRRNYYVLKTRYSHDAEWIPVPYNDVRPLNEFTIDPIPRTAVRYSVGVPIPQYRSTINLHRVGFGIEVPDLITEYLDLKLTEEFEEEQRTAVPETRKRKFTQEEEEYQEELLARQEELASRYRGASIGTYYGRPHIFFPK